MFILSACYRCSLAPVLCALEIFKEEMPARGPPAKRPCRTIQLMRKGATQRWISDPLLNGGFREPIQRQELHWSAEWWTWRSASCWWPLCRWGNKIFVQKSVRTVILSPGFWKNMYFTAFLPCSWSSGILTLEKDWPLADLDIVTEFCIKLLQIWMNGKRDREK